MLKLASTFQKVPHRFPHNLRYGYITAFRLLHMVFYLLIEGWRYYYGTVNFFWHIITSYRFLFSSIALRTYSLTALWTRATLLSIIRVCDGARPKILSIGVCRTATGNAGPLEIIIPWLLPDTDLIPAPTTARRPHSAGDRAVLQ